MNHSQTMLLSNLSPFPPTPAYHPHHHYKALLPSCKTPLKKWTKKTPNKTQTTNRLTHHSKLTFTKLLHAQLANNITNYHIRELPSIAWNTGQDMLTDNKGWSLEALAHTSTTTTMSLCIIHLTPVIHHGRSASHHLLECCRSLRSTSKTLGQKFPLFSSMSHSHPNSSRTQGRIPLGLDSPL